QYTHVRLAGILRNFEAADASATHTHQDNYDFSILQTDEEWALVRNLENYRALILRAQEEFEPSLISTYLLNLASDFNRFYQVHRVISENKNLTLVRIGLVKCLKTVLGQGLSILGLVPLENM
ncbi:MAG: DALR anticodon-binding domain-containing protein, partial [Planctomycetota bacterium]